MDLCLVGGVGAVIDLLAVTTSKATIYGIQTTVHSQVDDKMWHTKMKMGKSCFLFINWAGALSASSQRSTLIFEKQMRQHRENVCKKMVKSQNL